MNSKPYNSHARTHVQRIKGKCPSATEDRLVRQDRAAFHAEIATFYKEDHDKAMRILEEKAPGWEKAFLEQRKATMHKVAEHMPAMFAKYPHLLTRENTKPYDSRGPGKNEFKWIVLNIDPELHFFTTALAFSPGQFTPPHTHKTLCYGVQYKGETEEILFDHATLLPIEYVFRSGPEHIEIATPEGDGDLHAVGNAKHGHRSTYLKRGDVAIAIHLYDGYDLKQMLEKSIVIPMISTRKTHHLGGAAYSLEVPGFPSKQSNGVYI